MKVSKTPLYFLLFSLLILVGTVFWKVNTVQGKLKEISVLEKNLQQKEDKIVASYREYLKKKAKLDNIRKKIKKIKSYLRSISYNYRSDKFRNKVDAYTQKFGLLVHSFKFNQGKSGLLDSFSISTEGLYLDMIRFLYFLAKDFTNLDLSNFYFYRKDIYQKRINSKIEGALCLYERKKR